MEFPFLLLAIYMEISRLLSCSLGHCQQGVNLVCSEIINALSGKSLSTLNLTSASTSEKSTCSLQHAIVQSKRPLREYSAQVQMYLEGDLQEIEVTSRAAHFHRITRGSLVQLCFPMFFLRPSHGLRVICHLPEAVSKPSSDPWKQQRTQVNIVNMRVPLDGEHGKCMVPCRALRKRNSSGHLEEASFCARIHPSISPAIQNPSFIRSQIAFMVQLR